MNSDQKKIGSTKSKSPQLNGDPQVQVLNHLELNAEAHADHEIKMTLTMVVLQLLLTAIKWYKKNTRTQALKAARSVAAIQQI